MHTALMVLVLGASSGFVLVALGLGSLIFLSSLLFVVALTLRSRWDRLGGSDGDTPRRER